MKAWKATMLVWWGVAIMTKLLSANFFRLKKNKCFWVCMIFMLAAGVFFPVMRYVDMQKSGTVNTLDNGFFACALFIGVLASVFAAYLSERNTATARFATKWWLVKNARRSICPI